MFGGEEHLAQLLDGGSRFAFYHLHVQVGLDDLVVGLCFVAQRPRPHDGLGKFIGNVIRGMVAHNGASIGGHTDLHLAIGVDG